MNPSSDDWIFAFKSWLKRRRGFATVAFYFTDLLYLRLGERRRFLASFPATALRLNLGAGFRTSPPGFRGVDCEAYPGIEVVGELAALPFRSGSVDGILCEMVLEHVPDARGACTEFKRVLRPGGRLYLALPFLWPYHASPHDYWRWTASGVQQELVGLEILAKGVSGGPTTTLINVLHEWLAIAFSFNLDALYRIWYLALIPLLFPFKLLDHLLANFRHAEKIGALFYVHARKPPLPERPAPAPAVRGA